MAWLRAIYRWGLLLKKKYIMGGAQWHSEYCVQCNQCSFVCPHAAIRPFLLEEDELEEAPEGYIVRDYKGKTD